LAISDALPLGVPPVPVTLMLTLTDCPCFRLLRVPPAGGVNVSAVVEGVSEKFFQFVIRLLALTEPSPVAKS